MLQAEVRGRKLLCSLLRSAIQLKILRQWRYDGVLYSGGRARPFSTSWAALANASWLALTWFNKASGKVEKEGFPHSVVTQCLVPAGQGTEVTTVTGDIVRVQVGPSVYSTITGTSEGIYSTLPSREMLVTWLSLRGDLRVLVKYSCVRLGFREKFPF